MKIIKTVYTIQLRATKTLTVYITLLPLIFLFNQKMMAQETNQIVRLAKIKVEASQLEKYNAALKEQMNAAVRIEPGVLTYYAVADKSDPSNITILEIYADIGAYNSHIATPHFKKYKETVKGMVKSLELIEVKLIGSAKKPNM
jgi:Uncharacterized conserved protein